MACRRCRTERAQLVTFGTATPAYPHSRITPEGLAYIAEKIGPEPSDHDVFHPVTLSHNAYSKAPIKGLPLVCGICSQVFFETLTPEEIERFRYAAEVRG